MDIEWRKYKVEDFAKIVGGGTPSTKQDTYWEGDIPWLTPKDLSREYSRYISRGERNISRVGLDSSSAHILPPKTVLLTSRAPVGYVAIAKNAIATNQGFRNLVIRDGFDAEFVYYLLSNNTDYLKQYASGSTFQELSGSTLKSLEFLMPPYYEQRAVAHILGSLDDKIELNRRMNKTLETMASTIFKSWFVDFDPVIDNAVKNGNPIPEAFAGRALQRKERMAKAKAEGKEFNLPDEISTLFPDSFQDSELGETPKGWIVLPLPEIIEVNPLRTLKKGNLAPYLKMKNMPEHSARVLNWQDGIFGSGAKFINGDTLVARITPCLENGKGAYVDFLTDGKVGYGSTEYIIFRSKEPLPLEYSYFLSRTQNFLSYAITNMTGTSGRQRVPASAFSSYLVVKPSEQIARWFGKISGLIMCNMKKNDEESHTLISLRDNLLPELISGELRVTDNMSIGDNGV